MHNQLTTVKQDSERNERNQQLEMLETQLNAKILQMQEKHAKVSRLKLDR